MSSRMIQRANLLRFCCVLSWVCAISVGVKADEIDHALPEDGASPAPRSERSLRNPRIPLFQNIRPNWSVELAGSLKGLGAADFQGNHAKAFSVQTEWQPEFLQDIGVLGAGPTVAMYPIFGDNTPTSSALSLWSFGGRVRYQARFLREQPLVPFAGYAVESLGYRFSQGLDLRGRLLLRGPFFGAMLYLNLFEPGSAAEFYVTHGVLRSYLVGEVRMVSGEDENLEFDGRSLFLGLRFEF